MDNDTFWTLVGEFGPGIASWTHHGEICSNPFYPVIDRAAGEICCVTEATLFSGGFGRLNMTVGFISEFSRTMLSLKGSGVLSTRPDDLAAAWDGLAERLYGNRSCSRGLVALRCSPMSAQLWDLIDPKPRMSLIFDHGNVKEVYPR